MNWFAIFAIYALFWVICGFIVLPFGVRTPDQSGEVMVRGQADSAPTNFRPVLIIARTTLMASILFGLYYANYVQGWITAEDMRYLIGAPS